MSKPTILAAGIGAAGVVCAGLGALVPGPWAWLAWWVALSCALASAAYLCNQPAILAKRNGRLVWWRALPLLPYLLAYRIGCAIRRRRRRGRSAWDEITPGLYVGGWVQAAELPPGVGLVVDLTSEWSAPAAVRARAGYRSLPVLDGATPHDEEQFLELLGEIAPVTTSVYIHCESGEGRAPTAGALALLVRGVVQDPDAAIELVLKNRPGAHLTRSDLRFIRSMAGRIAP
jgi:hypothetical protein